MIQLQRQNMLAATSPIGVVAVVLSIGLAAWTLIEASCGMLGCTLPAVAVCILLTTAVCIDVRLVMFPLVAAMLLSPEVSVGQAGARALTLRLEDLLLPLVLLGLLGRRVVRPTATLHFGTLAVPIGFAAFARILSSFLAAKDGLVVPSVSALYVIKTLEYFVVFYVACNAPLSLRDSNRLLVAVVLTALVTAGVASLDIATGQRLSAPFEGDKAEPNTLGGYLTLMLALIGGYVMTFPARGVKLVGIICIGVLSVTLLFTLSRASYLAAIAVVLTLGFVQRSPGVLLFVAGAAVLLVAFGPESFHDRILSTIRTVETPFGERLLLEQSAASKLGVWVWVRAALETRPFCGWGMTGVGLIDAEYPRMFAEGGLLGLAAFMMLQVALFRLGTAGLRAHDPGTRALATGFLAGLVGLLVHGLGANTFLIVRIMEPFWFLAGLLAFRLRFEATAPFEHPAAAPGRRLESRGLGREPMRRSLGRSPSRASRPFCASADVEIP